MNVQLENIHCKKTAIFESTLSLIKANGFHGTPMSQIAKNAGVAAGTIYHYFDSKDTLIQNLYLNVRERISAIIPQQDDETPFNELFLQYWITQCEFFIENENILYFLEQYMTSPYRHCNPEIEAKLFASGVVAFFQRGINSGWIKNLDYQLLVPVVHGSIIAAAKYHLSGHYEFTKDRLRETALVIWDGIKTH